MLFVYIHIIWFACWIGFGVEKYPYGLLTMIVSLEAIFLSTFVMISQNRADAKRQVIADQQWTTVQDEDQQNIQLLDLSNQILTLTREVHAYVAARGDHAPAPQSARPALRRRLSARGYARPMATPPSPSLSASQLATLAALGEERSAAVGDVLYRVGDADYPFIAILEGEVAILDAAGNEIIRHGPPASWAS